MIKRYVLDGPPGAGKTTLLSGKTEGIEGVIQPNLSDHGYEGVGESAAKAYFELEKKGLEPAKNRELWLARIVEMERDNYLSATSDKTYFFDRCFHYWVYCREGLGLKLPGWYDEFNAQIRFSDPIFICAPIKSFDLSIPQGHRTRSHPFEERQQLALRTKSIYQRLGYTVVEVPVFCEGDKQENNRQRIQLILQHIN